MLKHFGVFLLCHRKGAKGSEKFVTKPIVNTLVRLFNDVVVSAFTTVPFNRRSAVLSVVKRMLSIEESVELCEDIKMLII